MEVRHYRSHVFPDGGSPVGYTGIVRGRRGLTRVRMATVRNMGWCSVLGVIPPGGLYIDGLHSQNPQRNQGAYSDFKKGDTLFFQVEHTDSYVLRV